MTTLSLDAFLDVQPRVVHFFKQAMRCNQLVNSYLMVGKDTATMVSVILRLAQILNCENRPDAPLSACGQCQTCLWIGKNAHPKVLSISNLSFYAGAEAGGGKSKSAKPSQSIKVEQLEYLLSELSRHNGGFRRMVIISGAESMANLQGELMEGICWPPTPVDSLDLGDKHFAYRPVDKKVFTDRLANKFLKTLEEPPKDAMFFILTDSEQKLLPTIVSRCQRVSFQMPQALLDMSADPDIEALLSPLFNRSRNWIECWRQWQDILTQSGYVSDQLLHQAQLMTNRRLTQLSPTPSGLDTTLFNQYHQQIMWFQEARQMLSSHVKEEAVLEHLFYQIHREGR